MYACIYHTLLPVAVLALGLSRATLERAVTDGEKCLSLHSDKAHELIPSILWALQNKLHWIHTKASVGLPETYWTSRVVSKSTIRNRIISLVPRPSITANAVEARVRCD